MCWSLDNLLMRGGTMPKIEEIYVEAKRSKNFQTLTLGRKIALEFGDNAKTVEQDTLDELNAKLEQSLARL